MPIELLMMNQRSAVPDPMLRTAARVDPYWSGLWSPGGAASWVNAWRADALVRSGQRRRPKHLSFGSPDDFSWLANTSRRNVRLDALAVLDSWRTATSEQIAAFTGSQQLATGRSQAMSELFRNNLVDTGVYAGPLWDSSHTPRGALYRPSAGTTFDRRVAPHLTYAERVSVTGGNSWEAGGHFDRHNVLTTELALRVAEFCEIGTVVGEKLSTHNLLAYESLGRPTPTGSQRSADATFIRTDGMRIAVEMTATVGESFLRKVKHWVELIDSAPLNRSGLVVLFVIADKQNATPSERRSTLKTVRAAIARACHAHPGTPYDQTKKRIFVAEWSEWFPRAGYMTHEFLGLEAWRLTGHAPDEAWAPFWVLDVLQNPYDPHDDDAMMAVLENMGLLRSTPYWLPGDNAPELWPLTLKAAGILPSEVPVAGYTPYYTGTRTGVVERTLMPERVRVRTRPPRRSAKAPTSEEATEGAPVSPEEDDVFGPTAPIRPRRESLITEDEF